jgi:disulfide bond formation protein DsbB
VSQHHSKEPTHSLNANLVAFILLFSFVIVSTLVFSRLSPLSPRRDAGGSVEVARAEPTASPPSTVTPTLRPTDTPLPTLTPTSRPTDTPPPTATPTDLPTTAAPPQPAADSSADTVQVSYDTALVEQGQQLFTLCAACHGPDARGVPNLGKDLVASEFVHTLSDEELLAFIKTGRPMWDPLNTTGIDMPPKGGNPALTDDDILAIIAYVRTLSAGGG